MKPIILDTGPIVALLDKKDPCHDWVVPKFNQLRGRLVTSGAVVTEATFFLQDARDGMDRLLELLECLSIEVFDVFQTRHIRAASLLMRRYADTPMDFADATLVVLAAELATNRVVTLDERGFRTYRHGRGQAFQLLLQDGPTS